MPATNYFAGSKPQATVPVPAQPGDGPPVDLRLPPANVHLGWALNQGMDMHVYLSTSPTGDVFGHQRKENHDKDLPNFVWENLTLGNWKDSRTVEMDVKFPEVSIVLCLPCNITSTSYIRVFYEMVLCGWIYFSPGIAQVPTLRTLGLSLKIFIMCGSVSWLPNLL